MNKLQKFNHVLFAIIGSGLILAVLAWGIFVTYRIIFDTKESDSPPPLDNETVKQLLEENSFQQTVSFEPGYWGSYYEEGQLDSIKSPYYIIPIEQTSLQDKQTFPTEEDSGPVMAMIARPDRSYARNYKKHLYNNVIIYNSDTQKVSKIFNDRNFISDIDYHFYRKNHFLVITTINNEMLSKSYEQQSENLYIYKLADSKLSKVSLQHFKFRNLKSDSDLPFLLLNGKYDFDRNTKYDEYDPYRLYQLDYETLQVKPFPDAAMTEELQKILDGRKGLE